MATKIALYTIVLSLIFSQFVFSQAQSTYIIQMDLSAMPKPFSSPHSWYMSIIESVADKSKHVYTYTNVIHGFCALLTPSEVEAIENSTGYVSWFLDVELQLDTTHSSEFLGLNSLSGVWPTSGYGENVIIGVVDSGVWPESKSYDDDGMPEIPSRWKGICEVGTDFNSSMCNKKLIGARFFNKGLIANFPNDPIQMNSPRDTVGHGTYTSSMAAGNYVNGASFFGYANGTASGMAPRARVAVYKVFFTEGGFQSDFLAAIDQAITDRVDVLSLSITGHPIPLYQDALAVATFAAVEKGIFVSTSGGNWGPYFKSLNNGAPWVLTAAAGTIDRKFRWNVILEGGVSVTGTSFYFRNSDVPKSPIIYVGECEKVKYRSQIENKTMVCEPGNYWIHEQIRDIESGGAAGVIIITNNPPMGMDITLPVLYFDRQNGETIKDYINSRGEAANASLAFQGTFFGAMPAPRVASYSARGPYSSCPFVLKPDLMAPGDMILASWSPDASVTYSNLDIRRSEFNILYGTSVSSAHAAGVAVLLKGAHPDWSPAAIRSAMMTTSDELDNVFQPIQEVGDNFTQPATPLAMGAGHINPNKALDPGLIYDAYVDDYINLLCALNFTKTQMQSVTRSSNYNCSNPSLDLNYPSFLAYFNSNDTDSDTIIVREFQRTVTYVGDGASTYTAKLTPVNGANVRVEPEKLVFKEKNEKRSYKLSFEGPKLIKDVLAYGSLSWVESEGKHVVRSPIVATSLSFEVPL